MHQTPVWDVVGLRQRMIDARRKALGTAIRDFRPVIQCGLWYCNNYVCVCVCVCEGACVCVCVYLTIGELTEKTVTVMTMYLQTTIIAAKQQLNHSTRRRNKLQHHQHHQQQLQQFSDTAGTCSSQWLLHYRIQCTLLINQLMKKT